MHNTSEYPVFRNDSELQNFFIRAAPFIDSDKVQVAVEAGPLLERLGSFEQHVEIAGEIEAVFEIIDEIKRDQFALNGELPHLVVFPSGWIALLRHFDSGAIEGCARVRVMVYLGDTENGTQIAASIAQILAGLYDVTHDHQAGDLPKTSPLINRSDQDWPDSLAHMVDRKEVDEAYQAIRNDRKNGDKQELGRVRSDLIDQYLSWIAVHRPIIRPDARHLRRAEIASRRGERAQIDLKDHVINMEYGELSQYGQFQTTPSDVARLVEQAHDWVMADQRRRLMIYAHGGMVSEKRALEYAKTTAHWWLENDVWPIFCVWESDALSTIMQLASQVLGGRQRGLLSGLGDLRDAAIQQLCHVAGRRIWESMKYSARQCSADGDQHGLTLLVTELRKVFGEKNPTIDLVGHSAGSIVLLHLLQRLHQNEMRAHSFQTLAPAATTELYRWGLSTAESDLRCRIYTMTDEAERADNVVGLYGKSLLYLVSRGFEEVFGEKISGLQKDLLADHALVTQLTRWSQGVTREALVFSPTPDGRPQRLQSNATSHAAFDEDAATMWSVIRFIHADNQKRPITPFPDFPTQLRSNDNDMLHDLPEEVRSYLAITDGTTSSSNNLAQSGTANAGVARPAARLALTVGIDHYAGNNRLQGCVRDSNNWRDLLTERGYHVTQLIHPEETGRDALVQSLRSFVAQAGAGDSLIWHFSGHGMEIMPEQGSEDDFETTGRDQAIVAANSSEGLESQLSHALIDDDIYTMLQRLNPAATLHVFFDSCYSGTATRLSLPGRKRTLGTLFRKNYAPHRHSLTAPLATARGAYGGANHILYGAASATQAALEDGNPPEGAFSRAVRELLRSRPGPLSNRDFPRRIDELMPGNYQNAGVHCDPSRLDQPFPLV